MSKASDKRLAEIRRVSETVVGVKRTATGIEQDWHITDPERIAALIRALDSFGRTERWHYAIEQWALAVQTEPLEWAFLQYQVWATHAAD